MLFLRPLLCLLWNHKLLIDGPPCCFRYNIYDNIKFQVEQSGHSVPRANLSWRRIQAEVFQVSSHISSLEQTHFIWGTGVKISSSAS